MKKCMGCMRDYSEEHNCCPVCGYSEEQMRIEAEEKPEILHPETILGGRYIIGRALSYTEYSIVYIAWDALLQKRVAVKEYLPLGAGGRVPGENKIRVNEQKRILFQNGRMAFEKEIRILNRNQEESPMVNVYRCVQENGTSYMVMEYLTGCTLQDRVEESGAFSDSVAADIFKKVASAIEQLHGKGICHWNLSPDNIYLEEDGRIRLIDPGMAKKEFFYAVEGDIDIYHRSFIAPELLRGRIVYENADLYSLGALYFYLLTGTAPKDSTSRKQKRGRREGSGGQARLLSILMEPDPGKRPESIQKFWEVFEAKQEKVSHGQK